MNDVLYKTYSYFISNSTVLLVSTFTIVVDLIVSSLVSCWSCQIRQNEHCRSFQSSSRGLRRSNSPLCLHARRPSMSTSFLLLQYFHSSKFELHSAPAYHWLQCSYQLLATRQRLGTRPQFWRQPANDYNIKYQHKTWWWEQHRESRFHWWSLLCSR